MQKKDISQVGGIFYISSSQLLILQNNMIIYLDMFDYSVSWCREECSQVQHLDTNPVHVHVYLIHNQNKTFIKKLFLSTFWQQFWNIRRGCGPTFIPSSLFRKFSWTTPHMKSVAPDSAKHIRPGQHLSALGSQVESLSRHGSDIKKRKQYYE